MSSVSIIIPNYNGKQYLKGCFDSLLGLEYPKDKLEIILIDNNSYDDSIEFTKKNYPFVKIIELKENLGYAGGCDVGVKNAKHSFIIFLNNDCLVHKDFVSELLNTYFSEENIGAVSSVVYDYTCTKIDFIGSELNFYGHGRQIHFGEFVDTIEKESYPDYIISPCGAAMLMKKDTYIKVGGYDTDYFAYFEDVDLGWRLWIMGYKVKLAKNSIVGHIHQGSAKFLGDAKKLRLCERNSLITIIKNYEKENLKSILGPAILLMLKRMIDDTIIIKGDFELNKTKMEKEKYPFDSPIKMNFYKIFNKITKEMSSNKDLKFELISNKAYARIIAIDDVISNLDKILQKREFVQSKRKRSDKEIFPLFRHPEFVSFPGEELKNLQEKLIDFFELEKIWT